MSPAAERSEHLFVVRVWQEPEQVKSGEWRGSIEHVGSGQRLYFVSLDDLNDFIALRLNLRSPRGVPPTANEGEPGREGLPGL